MGFALLLSGERSSIASTIGALFIGIAGAATFRAAEGVANKWTFNS
jgi:hypothetical protein